MDVGEAEARISDREIIICAHVDNRHTPLFIYIGKQHDSQSRKAFPCAVGRFKYENQLPYRVKLK